MTGLLLVAASGLAREALEAVRAADPDRPVVVVDDDPSRWGRRLHGAPVVGGLDLVREYPDHRLLVCAGSGRSRRALVARLGEAGVATDRYETVVHPAVTMPASCTVGAGSILLEGVVMTADVRLGEHVVAMPHVSLTHDDVVADYATLCAGVTLGGSVTVGSAAYLGMRSAVRERLTIGADAVLGMGAALIDDLPPGETWAGVPARSLTLTRRTP